MLGYLIQSAFGLFYVLLTPSVTISFLCDVIQNVPHRVCTVSVCYNGTNFQYEVIHQHMVDYQPPASDKDLPRQHQKNILSIP
jgi:hypothetical protein